MGVILSKDDYNAIMEMFRRAWPYPYGSKEINSRSDKNVETHRLAYQQLINLVWPSDTSHKFYALEAFPPRSRFHTERVDACVRKLFQNLFFFSDDIEMTWRKKIIKKIVLLWVPWLCENSITIAHFLLLHTIHNVPVLRMVRKKLIFD